MAEILKYKVHLTRLQTLTLNKGAEILTVQEQAGELCMWAKVSGRVIDAANSELVSIYMVGTGHEVPVDASRYINTIQVDNGGELLIIHVYEGPRR